MVDIAGVDLGIDPIGFTSSNLGVWLTWIAIILCVILVVIILWYIWYSRRIYNKTIVLYENIAGMGWRKTKVDRARIVKIGRSGEEVLYLRKHKVYRTAYGKKMGNNEYWFAVGEDGYWYNIILGDLDAKMGVLDIEPIDRDMRYMYVAISNNIQERYDKQSFMSKYGMVIAMGGFVIIMMIGMWFLLGEMGDMMGTSASIQQETVDKVVPIMENLERILARMDSIGSTSGISGGGG